MSPASCGCSPPTSFPVNVIGTAGNPAYSSIAANFTIPTNLTQVGVQVVNADWIAIQSYLVVDTGSGAAHFKVIAKTGNSLTLQFVSQTGDAASGTAVLAGVLIAPSGQQGVAAADPLTIAHGGTGAITASAARLALAGLDISAVNALTDSTGGAASDTLAAGVGIQSLAFFVNLSAITATTICSFTPGYAFKVLAIQFSAEIAVTTGAKAATITPAVNGSGVTGGALALTSANCTPKGTTVSGSTITAGNTGTSAQTLALVASAVTAFSEGTGWIILKVQNLDTSNAVASIASKVNSLLSAVKP